MLLENNYIENILDTFNQYDEVDVVGGYILNEWDKTNFKNNIVVRVINFLGLYKGSLMPGSFSNSGIFIELQGLKKI